MRITLPRKGVGVADEKIAEFEAGYDAIVQTAAKEYENEPPSDYYKDGYNLYLRMAAYRHNHSDRFIATISHTKCPEFYCWQPFRQWVAFLAMRTLGAEQAGGCNRSDII